MIKFKLKTYSSNMVNKITTKLDTDRIEDYEVSDIIAKSDISINTNLSEVKIYIPEDLDYSQYSIDTWIRKNIFGMRTSMDYEDGIYIMSLKSTVTFPQYIKLIKYIIDSEGFCQIYDK